jgi:hypothetical protein
MTTIEIIKIIELPKGLTKINLSDSFDEKISIGFFYEGIVKIVFGWHFNQPLDVGVFPDSVKKIVFGQKYDQPIPAGLFNKVEKIIFSHNFNQPLVPQTFSSFNKEIIFSWNFNQPISKDLFPEGIEKIMFGRMFNQDLDGYLPKSLNTLLLESEYTKTVPVVKEIMIHINNESVILPKQIEKISLFYWGDKYDAKYINKNQSKLLQNYQYEILTDFESVKPMKIGHSFIMVIPVKIMRNEDKIMLKLKELMSEVNNIQKLLTESN